MPRDVPAWTRWALLGVKPPTASASRAERLRFIRDLQVRCAILAAPIVLLAVALGPPVWALLLVVAGLLLLLGDAIYLTTKIRRMDSRSP